jgi:monoterpene epsilon-lactone hydrolase
MTILQRSIKDVESKVLSIDDISEYNIGEGRAVMEANVKRDVVPKGMVREKVVVHGTPCEWIYFKQATNYVFTETTPPENMKTILYLHGGGYVALNIDTHIQILKEVAIACNDRTTKILAVDYKLAPEYPFPTAIHEVAAVYKWMITDQGIKPSSIAIMGDSAGGGLTVAACLYIKSLGLPLPAALGLMSPWIDLECNDHSYIRNASEDFLSRIPCQAIGKAYAGEAGVKHPLVSPIHADLSGLPPMIIQAGEKEVFVDSIVDFARKSINAGNEVVCEVYKDMCHVHQAFSTLCSIESSTAFASLGSFIIDHVNAAGRVIKPKSTEDDYMVNSGRLSSYIQSKL